jgi:signal transduction histidine kinase
VRDELSALAATLNSMLDRVGDGVRRQRRFVAAASHDLRSPIAALQTELELALDPRTNHEEVRAAAQQAHQDAVRLGQLAAALLELAAVEPEGRAIVRSEVDLASMLEAVVARTGALARSRDVAVRTAAVNRRVRVDRARLEQAIANLVANAISHGPADAEVSVAARVERRGAQDPDSSHGEQLVVEVLDRGAGIEPADLATLFEPFRRGEGARGSGAGLGLATAAAAVQAHRGTIGVSRREGGGSRFWIRVPL